MIDIDHTILGKELWGRLNPSSWPISLNELPMGCALVGGSIRDALLNRLHPKPDLDIVIPSHSVNFAQDLSDQLGATCVVLDKERDIARLVVDGWTFDFAKQIGNSLEEDLLRRDFRINAIALTLDSNSEIIDPTNGIQDLINKRLVAISEKNLIDDPLRLLRAFRLMSEVNFELDNQTKEYCINHIELLSKVAPERIKSEIQKLIAGNWADNVLPLVNEIGLLNEWTDENQSPRKQSFYLRDAKNFYADELALALPWVRLVNLLSDKALIKLRFSKKEIDICQRLRKWQKQNDGIAFQTLNESERFKLHIELENHLPALILSIPSEAQKVWLRRWRNPLDPLFHPSSPLNGFDLKQILGIPEGPWLGEIIDNLSKEKAFNRINSHHEAVELARYLWKQKQPFM